MNEKHSAGKGSKYRPVDFKKWEEGWDKAFGNKNKIKKHVVIERQKGKKRKNEHD
jgi:hypothetical protein